MSDNSFCLTRLHVYISSNESNAILTELKNMPCYNLVQVTGLNEQDTINYLSAGQSKDNKEAAVKIFKYFGRLPIAIRFVKAYCSKVRINYEDYSELVEEAENDNINKANKIFNDSASNVYHAIIMPFIPSDGEDTTAVLFWKILCCISYFHYERIPRFALEQCCHNLRKGKAKKPRIENKIQISNLVSKLHDYDMCIESDEENVTFHEAVLNAFRTNKYSVLSNDFKPLEKATEIMSRGGQ